MTYPDAFGEDGWAWSTGHETARRRWRASDWLEDPLERVLAGAVVVLGAVVLWTLVTSELASGTTAHAVCVAESVDRARAFAAVLGDDRPVPVHFAERACARR